jgi:hypothetical protein
MVRPLPSFATRKQDSVFFEKWAQRLAQTTLTANGDQSLLHGLDLDGSMETDAAC